MHIVSLSTLKINKHRNSNITICCKCEYTYIYIYTIINILRVVQCITIYYIE